MHPEPQLRAEDQSRMRESIVRYSSGCTLRLDLVLFAPVSSVSQRILLLFCPQVGVLLGGRPPLPLSSTSAAASRAVTRTRASLKHNDGPSSAAGLGEGLISPVIPVI